MNPGAREPEREGDGLPRPARAGRGDAPVVAVDDDVAPLLRGPACVPDARDVLHLVRVLLAYLRRVDEDEGVLPDVPCPLGQDRAGDLPPEGRVLDVAREPLLRLDRRYVVLYGAHDGRELGVPGGLDSVGGLPDEPRLRLREMGKNFTHEVVVLLFRFCGDYGIIHGVAPFWLVGFASRYYTEDRREGATLFFV